MASLRTTIRQVLILEPHGLLRVGVFAPRLQEIESLGPGEVGCIIAGIKDVHETKIGDTITDAATPTQRPLPGFKAVKAMVFSGLYPADTAQYPLLRDAVEKLRLNDASFTYEPETSMALGFGFRCGFLGLLHMEIIGERLEREFGYARVAKERSSWDASRFCPSPASAQMPGRERERKQTAKNPGERAQLPQTRRYRRRRRDLLVWSD